MNFQHKLQKYQNTKINRSLGAPHTCPKNSFYKYFIIIPSYSENLYIHDTLDTVAIQNKELLSQILVVVVINNSIDDNRIIKNNNYNTYRKLLNQHYVFELIIIDSFSRKNALSENQSGVGMARRIGYDYCIRYAKKNSLFFSLDADTLIHKHYLLQIIQIYKTQKFSSAVVNFQHQSNDNPKIQQAIVKYETLLKNIAFNIRKTGSPYGFVSMGSTIICTMEAYIAVGGMPMKKATEDFYFLQQLAKFSRIHIIDKVLVYPSSRAETRVYLGTGFRMSNLNKNTLFKDLYINPEAYIGLKKLFKIIETKWDCSIIEIISSIAKINGNLYKYLESENFSNAFKKIQKNSINKKQLLNQFHTWFDNFKIYKFLKIYINEAR